MTDQATLPIEAKYLRGENAQHYKSMIRGVRHWAFAEVTEVRPLEPNKPDCMIGNRALVTLGNTDNGKHDWCMYGPRSLAVGTKVELFEFLLYGKWNPDFVALVD